jgi:hypothetical protein
MKRAACCPGRIANTALSNECKLQKIRIAHPPGNMKNGGFSQ